MTWWAWILFWIVFWTLAATYLVRKVWRVWPHARDFGRTVSDAWNRIEGTRAQAAAVGSDVTRKEPAGVLTRSDVDELAWNTSASTWRDERRRARRRQRELRLDQKAEVWASWQRPLD